MYIKGILIFIVCTLLSGCTVGIRQNSGDWRSGSRPIHNDTSFFYIERVMDNGAIVCQGKTCNMRMSVSRYSKRRRIYGYVLHVERHLRVFLEKIEGLDYRSGYVLKVPENVNFEKKGVFEYTDEYGVKRKILHLAIVKDSKKQ